MRAQRNEPEKPAPPNERCNGKQNSSSDTAWPACFPKSQLIVDLKAVTLSRYRVELQEDRRHLKEVSRPRLAETLFRSAQLTLFDGRPGSVAAVLAYAAVCTLPSQASRQRAGATPPPRSASEGESCRRGRSSRPASLAASSATSVRGIRGRRLIEPFVTLAVTFTRRSYDNMLDRKAVSACIGSSYEGSDQGHL
jgi:hypothetical protein